jgi:hypothetical protein
VLVAIVKKKEVKEIENARRRGWEGVERHFSFNTRIVKLKKEHRF